MKRLIICLMIYLSMISYQTPVLAQNDQQLFQKGLIQEEGEGNLTQAIEIYNSIVKNNNANRTLRAKALLHVGVCHEKLGNQNARKTYQRLIAEYSDQEAIVAIGLQKLKDLKKPETNVRPEGITTSQMWSPAQDTYGVSPDGRYLNYIDWNNISINIKDLKNGKTRVLSKIGTWEKPMQFPDKSIWSPDGKKLAYYWFVENETELHIVNADGTSDEIIAKGKNQTTPWPITWSPDGKYILGVTAKNIDNKIRHKMVQVSAIDGSVKILKDFGNLSCGGSMMLSPDNKYIVYDLQQHENSQQRDIHILSLDGSIDKKLISNLEDDSNPIWSPKGGEVFFISTRYGTNDLWKLKIENGNGMGSPILVKSELGQGKRILLGVTNDNSVYYSTNNSRIDVYIAQLNHEVNKGKNQPVKISTYNTKRNMNAAWSPDGKLISYSRFSPFRDEILGHQLQFTIYDTTTGDSRNLNTELYGNAVMYNPQWSSNGEKLLIHGMIKDDHQGGLFLYDINTKEKSPLKTAKNVTSAKINDAYRSYAFSNDNKSVFYFSEDRKSILKYEIASNSESKVISGPKTLLYFKLSNDSSKIAFGYWYDDNKGIYVVDVSSGEKKKVFEAGSDCECSPNVLAWGKDDKYLYFKEGKFRNLKKINRINIDGGEPEEVLVFKDIFQYGDITQVNIHPDEKSVLVELSVGKEEIWKLEGIFND